MKHSILRNKVEIGTISERFTDKFKANHILVVRPSTHLKKMRKGHSEKYCNTNLSGKYFDETNKSLILVSSLGLVLKWTA